MLQNKLPYLMYKIQILTHPNPLDSKQIILNSRAKNTVFHKSILLKHEDNHYTGFTASTESSNIHIHDRQHVGMSLYLSNNNIATSELNGGFIKEISKDAGYALNKFMLLKICLKEYFLVYNESRIFNNSNPFSRRDIYINKLKLNSKISVKSICDKVLNSYQTHKPLKFNEEQIILEDFKDNKLYEKLGFVWFEEIREELKNEGIDIDMLWNPDISINQKDLIIIKINSLLESMNIQIYKIFHS